MRLRISIMGLALAMVLASTAATFGDVTPKFKKVFLTINMEQQSTWVRNFNPFSPDARMQAANGCIYEPLYIYNKATSKNVPWLATDASWNATYDVLTVKLRDGVKWSDGQPFTAKDVIFTFDLIKKNPTLTNNLGSIFTDILTGYKATDDMTVEFTFKKVYTPAYYLITGQLIVPEHIWKDVKDPAAWTNPNPVATGPCTEVTKFLDQIYVIEKNPNYWQPGKPYFQGIRFPSYPGNDQSNMGLAAGDLDWASNFLPDGDHTYVAKNPKYFHYYIVGGDPVALLLNTTLKPFDNAEVRKAISMGIDRQKICKIAEYNYIGPLNATGLTPSYGTWSDPEAVKAGTWTNYDVAAANAALDKLGFKKGGDGIRVANGKPMTFKLMAVNGWTDWISAAQIISQNLKDIGVAANLETPEQDSWQENLNKGSYEMALAGITGGATPYNFYRAVLSKLTYQPIGTSATENWARYISPAGDKALDLFSGTADPVKQHDAVAQLQKVFLEEAPVLPLFPGPDWYEYSTARFNGFPTKANPYAPGPCYNTPLTSMNMLLVLTTLFPN